MTFGDTPFQTLLRNPKDHVKIIDLNFIPVASEKATELNTLLIFDALSAVFHFSEAMKFTPISFQRFLKAP